MDIFENTPEPSFSWEDLGDISVGRSNLGSQMPVLVYRLLQYTLRTVLQREYGREEMIYLFREAGEIAGREFARNMLDLTQELNPFLREFQRLLSELKIGVMRVEFFDPETGHLVLTIGEDLDCSGLPVTGDTVCNYDEGFIRGVLREYTKQKYEVREIDCWATGDRVCRFDAAPSAKNEAPTA